MGKPHDTKIRLFDGKSPQGSDPTRELPLCRDSPQSPPEDAFDRAGKGCRVETVIGSSRGHSENFNRPQGSATSPQTFSVTAPQTAGIMHAPQSSSSPHPSSATPHSAPNDSQVSATQEQTLGVPLAPHDSGAVQAPQLSIPPHRSGTLPHSAPSELQV